MPRRNPYGWTFCPIVLFLLRGDCIEPRRFSPPLYSAGKLYFFFLGCLAGPFFFSVPFFAATFFFAGAFLVTFLAAFFAGAASPTVSTRPALPLPATFSSSAISKCEMRR